MISLIAAVSKNGVIGKDGNLPWRLKDELKFFTDTTIGGNIIVGRKTYLAIGRPLEGRNTIIVSKNKNLKVEGCTVSNSLAEALEFSKLNGKEIFIGGGAKLYSDSFEIADRIYLTIVDCYSEGDVFFPFFDKRNWKEEKIYFQEKNQNNIYSWSVFLFEKID